METVLKWLFFFYSLISGPKSNLSRKFSAINLMVLGLFLHQGWRPALAKGLLNSFWPAGHVRKGQWTGPTGALSPFHMGLVPDSCSHSLHLPFLPSSPPSLHFPPLLNLTSAFLARSTNQVLEPSLVFKVLVFGDHYSVNFCTKS